jgi:hypothetical protein
MIKPSTNNKQINKIVNIQYKDNTNKYTHSLLCSDIFTRRFSRKCHLNNHKFHNIIMKFMRHSHVVCDLYTCNKTKSHTQ